MFDVFWSPIRPLEHEHSSCIQQCFLAIIGGGIGGTSCSHFLWELLGDNILVDLYEEKHLGGRMATINVNGKEYESGGSIIHPANHYMKNFSDFLGKCILHYLYFVV